MSMATSRPESVIETRGLRRVFKTVHNPELRFPGARQFGRAVS
jgi:hypothetical protein